MHKINSIEDYQVQYQRSLEDPHGFWSQIASGYEWMKEWDDVLEWDFDRFDVKWFLGGKLNITVNCLDRHARTNPDRIAVIWEGNESSEPNRSFTYQELLDEVCRCANGLKSLGVQKGDRVCLYMPMVPELLFTVLACARIGAIHSVVFAGFSATSLRDRINDSGCCLVVTSDGAYRGPKQIPIKTVVDEAVQGCPSVRNVLVLKRTAEAVPFDMERDRWWHELIPFQSAQCAPEPMDSEDMLFILYTSGSTGKPKGVVHTCGGYMVYAGYTFANVFQYIPGEVYWCTADIGWITGHSYIAYGPLLNGATVLMFEGVPTYPDPGRFWHVVDKHHVNIFYTAPTAIRALEATGLDYVRPYRLDSIRVLGTVGEPINQEAWEWYHQNIGKGKCPIVDTWWQTETGGVMISPLAGITPEKPTFATLPLPGIRPVLVDGKGQIIEGNDVEGNLCISFPWPGMLRTTYGDHERCRGNYFAAYPGLYFTGDGCRRDTDGYYRIIGRVDDVINVSGHRLGTAEVENAINEHPLVVESAVVGYPHEIKGQGIYAFVICEHAPEDVADLHQEVAAVVAKVIGPIAKPDKVQVVPGLPKTRSGKIMRRILRKIAEKDTGNLGDTSTLLDPTVVDQIIAGSV